MKRLMSAILAAVTALSLTACGNSGSTGDSVERYKHIAGKFEEFYIGCGKMVDGIPDVNSVGDEDKHVIDRLPQVVKSDETGKLRLIVDKFLEETELEARYAFTEELLNLIFDTDAVKDTNEFFSDKKLALINSFWASEAAKPPKNEEQAYWLEQTYQYLVGHYMYSMIFSTVVEDFNYIKSYEYEDGTVYPYMEYYTAHIFYGILLDKISDQTLADLSLSSAHFAKLKDKSWRINNELRAYLDEGLHKKYRSDESKAKLAHALEIMDGAVYGAVHAENGGGALEGTEKPDVLFGGSGNDIISGSGSHDWLIGGEGDDILDGGPANDCLEGGAGNDTYIFGRTGGSDIIIDFDGSNTIRFEGVALNEVTAKSFTEDGLTDNVKLCITGTGSELVIKNYYSDEKYRQFELEFSDAKMKIDAPESPLSRIDEESESSASESGTGAVMPY